MAGRYFVATLLATVLAAAVLTAEASTTCHRRCADQLDLLLCLRRCKRAVQRRGRDGRSLPVAFDYPLQEQECGSNTPITDANITFVRELRVELMEVEDASSGEVDRVKIKWRTPGTGYDEVKGFEISIIMFGGSQYCIQRDLNFCRKLLLNRKLQAADALSENYFEYITDLPTGLNYRITMTPLPGQNLKDNKIAIAYYEARQCNSWDEQRKLWKPSPVYIVQTVGRNVTVTIFLAPSDLNIYEYELEWTCGPDQQINKFTVAPYNATGDTLNMTLHHLPPGACDISVGSALVDSIQSNKTSFHITDWTPANLTAHYDSTEVSVTFLAAPSEYNFPEYRICLVSTNTSDSGASTSITCDPLLSMDDSTGVVTAVFKDAKPLPTGQFYAVKVSAPYKDSQWTQVSAVHVNTPRPSNSIHIVLAVSLAAVIGLALLGALYYLRTKSPQIHVLPGWFPGQSGPDPECPDRRPTLLLLYSYDCPEHFKVVERAATFLQKMGFPVVLDMWCTNQIACVGKVAWAYEHLGKADYVIVLCSRGARHKMEDGNVPPLQEGLLGDMFTPWVNEIGSRIHSADDAHGSGSRQKYVVAYFSYSSAEDVPRTLRAVQPHYRLIKHMPDLFCHLLGIERKGPAGTVIVTGLEDIQETEEGQRLVEAVDAMQRICDQNPDWLFQANDGPAPDVIDVITSSTLPEEIPLLPTPSENSVDMENSTDTASVGDTQGDENAQPLLRNEVANAADGQQDDYRVDVCPAPEDVSAVTSDIEPAAEATGDLETARRHREGDDPESGIHTASELNMEGPTAQVRPPQITAAFAPQVPHLEYGATAQGWTSGNNPGEPSHFNPYTRPTIGPNRVQHFDPGNMYENPMYVRSPSYDHQPYNFGPGTGYGYHPGGSPYREGLHHNSDEQLDSGIFMAEIEEELKRHNQLVLASMPPE